MADFDPFLGATPLWLSCVLGVADLITGLEVLRLLLCSRPAHARAPSLEESISGRLREEEAAVHCAYAQMS
eukprot:NODE_7511_length_436_cov_179.251969.p4 GENE.NODE_7511_length_436_cov_179.251969~~NODE_7511_length_436_cov_179.251969.p4  ORF type:complete len:71 (-),score=24.37 NODE_7511_length_436_cov_179.251969:130-342(-)